MLSVFVFADVQIAEECNQSVSIIAYVSNVNQAMIKRSLFPNFVMFMHAVMWL